MSGLGRIDVSQWDSNDTHNHHSSINAKSGSYYRDKDPEPVQLNAESNGSRRPAATDEQHLGEARSRSRVSQNNDNSYYSEKGEIKQQFFRRSGSRSNSRSRSRSRSPAYRARRDAGSYDRNKTRTRISPLPVRDFNKRSGDHQFDQSRDCGWEEEVRKPWEKKCVRSSDYNTDIPEDNSRREHLHDGVSNIPCKFFAAGFCRNGKYCRFSHHGADRKQSQDNIFYRQDNNNRSGSKCNDVETLDNGMFREIEVSRASKGISESKGNGSSWIGDMEMSPDWNYGVQSLKNTVKDDHGVGIIGQISQSTALKDNLVTNYDQRSSVFTHGDNKPMVKKPIAASHQNKLVNIAPVQAFNQNTQNHNVLPYQSSLTAAAAFPVGLNLSNPESGKVVQNNHISMVEKAVPAQNTVTREHIDQITNISASIAHFLANGQPIPQIKQALQISLHSESSMAVQSNQATTALDTHSNPNQLWGLGMSTCPEGVPAVTASQVSNVDGVQELSLYFKASEEDRDKMTKEASKEEEGKKTGEDTKDAKNGEDEEDDEDGSDEENKKGKDPKGMKAFKFALVENVKELLKPAWKEGKMNKDGYKNIVKKVVEKVTGTIQNGNIPQTQEKIDNYLSASKPKLTKLVQAYISKVKKN